MIQNVNIGESLNPIRHANVVLRMQRDDFLQLFNVDFDLQNCLTTTYFRHSEDYHNCYFMMRAIRKVLTSTNCTLELKVRNFELTADNVEFLYDNDGKTLTPSELNMTEGGWLDTRLCETVLGEIDKIDPESDNDKISSLKMYREAREENIRELLLSEKFVI